MNLYRNLVVYKRRADLKILERPQRITLTTKNIYFKDRYLEMLSESNKLTLISIYFDSFVDQNDRRFGLVCS